MRVETHVRTRDYTSSDPGQYRYWSPSQTYACGDQLARMLQEGWELDDEIGVERLWFGDARHTCLYHVTLYRGAEGAAMSVLCNPFSSDIFHDERHNFKLVDHSRQTREIRFQVMQR